MAVRLSNLWWAAAKAASQFEPSASSPSPSRVKTRVAERAGVHLHAADLPRGMADVIALVVADGVEVGVGEVAAVGHDGVERLDAVALALDVAVAERVGGGLRRDLEHAVVEDVEDVEARQAAAGVAGARIVDQPQHAPAQRDSLEGEVVVGHAGGLTPSGGCGSGTPTRGRS
jgi:hypothetical protein